MKMNWKVGHQVEGCNVNFHKWKGIWIYKRSLNWFPFQRRKHQGKYDCDERQRWRRWKSWKKLGGWWSNTPHCSKKRNGASIYQKCKKARKKNKKKSKVDLILSYNQSHIFILDPQIGPQAFRHTHCTLGKSVFFNMRKGPIQGSICFKLVPGLLVPGPLSKVALIDGVFHVSHAGSCQWTW